MPAPITEKFEQMTLETTDNGTTWTKICGLMGVTVTRTATFDETEVPADCDDESLPLAVERAIRRIDVSVSAEGVWAQQSHEDLQDWFYSGTSKEIRVGHQNAATGDTQYEEGDALLTTLTNVRAKGQKVTATLEIQFDGTPTRIAKVA